MEKRTLNIILAITFVVVFILGVLLPVMNVDAAQYASISMEMFNSGSYLEIFHRYENYLDKPPLLFWLSEFSYKIFGIGDVAFKLPSILFTFVGLYSLFAFTKIFYNKKTATLAVIITATSQAYFLFNHDIRTDTILAGSVMFAIWQLVEFTENGKKLGYFFGFCGVALAMLAKGPIGLMVPVLAIGTHLLVTKQKRFLNPLIWIPSLFILAAILLPMSIGLYTQFGKEGLRFFYWTQSFGRLTGESTWKNNTSIFFFAHTFLWAFLPWCILAYSGLFSSIKKMVKKEKLNEYISLGGVVLPFIAFSLSKFKLPHYIFVFFPLFAVLTANFIISIVDNKKLVTIFSRVQLGIIFILIGLAAVVGAWAFPVFTNLLVSIPVITLFALSFYIYKTYKGEHKLLYPSLIAIIALNLLMNGHIYPELFKYDSGIEIAAEINERNINKSTVYSFRSHFHTMDVYSKHIARNFNNAEQIKEYLDKDKDIWVYVEKNNLEKIKSVGKVKEIFGYDHYHISMLTLPFLNPKMRESTLTRYFLVNIIK